MGGDATMDVFYFLLFIFKSSFFNSEHILFSFVTNSNNTYRVKTSSSLQAIIVGRYVRMDIVFF